MTSEKLSRSEIEAQLKTVRSFFDRVSNRENPVAAQPEDVPIDLIRELLESTGAEMEISREGRASLKKSQFRNLDTGKGPGLVEVMGRGRLMHYYVWALEVSKQMGMPKLDRDKSPEERSRARGLMQFMASVISLAAGVQAREEFAADLNQRVYNGLVVKGEQLGIDPEKIRQGFPGFKRKRKVPSAPPGMLGEAFQKMIGIF